MNATMRAMGVGFLLVTGLVTTAGCAASGLSDAKPATCTTGQPLDGRSFAVALVAERGGAPEKVEIAFARGALEASDARDQGYAPALYAVRTTSGPIGCIEFEAEARGPAGTRRFKGRVEGDQIVGTLMLVNDGSMPARFTFDGRSSTM